jgi:ribonuclease P protein component
MKEGKRLFVTDWLALNWMAGVEETKVGWTIPGYVGTAVTRNRLKRWLKEYLEKKWQPEAQNLQLHFLFKRKPAAFYKGLGHELFDSVVSSGLKNVERKTKTAK